MSLTLSQKFLFLLGVVLTILGSFLPWEQGGDFVPYWRSGIQVYPGFVDNGGVIIVSLSLVLLGLVYRLPNFINKPHLWFMGFTMALALISIYDITDIVRRRTELHNVFWAPTVDYGLKMVALGSLCLLVAGLLNYRTQHQMSRTRLVPRA